MKGHWAQLVSVLMDFLKYDHVATLKGTPVFDDMLILYNMAPNTSQPLQRAHSQRKPERKLAHLDSLLIPRWCLPVGFLRALFSV